MEIQSMINISKCVEIECENEFGMKETRQIGYLGSSIDKAGQQCHINIQLFEKENFEKNRGAIEKQVMEFFNYISACTKDSNLDVIAKCLPSNEEINNKVSHMNI